VSADLVAFLRARLDEDEQSARAATAGPWWHNPGKLWLGPEAFEQYDHTQGAEFVGYGAPHPFTGCIAATGPADDRQSMADADHIARHDPARVLAEVDAKRRVVALWREEPAAADLTWDGGWCNAVDEVLRLLALPYRDHPDYRAEWAPEAG
jgi:hypothetical protein